MNFYNEDEKKDGAPVIPSAASPFKKTSAFGKTPMFSRAAGSITNRLKNLSRKDMAFVAIGLSVLVMTPVAEYMMSQPSQDNMLKEGFGNRGDGSSGLYEPGINGLSQGSPDGSGEVITPLSSRDPASLILGSQPAQPVMPPAAPPSTSFRDAMKESGRNAFSEAAKSAGAPTPIPRMQAGLRSLSFGGGEGTRTSGSMGGGKIIEEAQSASNKAVRRSMLGPVAMAGYKGVSNTPNSSSKGAFEKLRAQADKSAGNFNGGSAVGSLDRAAADAVDIGRGTGGMGAGGESEKTGKPSNSTSKNEHHNSGETLAEMIAKKRMDKALEWEFFKKYEIPKQIITAILTGFNGALTKFVERNANSAFGNGSGAPPAYVCLGVRRPVPVTTPPYLDNPCDYPNKAYVNTFVKIKSDDEKIIGGWQNGSPTADRQCPCGVLSSKDYDAIMAGGGGGAVPPAGPGPGQTPTPGTPTPGTPTPGTPADPQVIAGVKETFSNYDTVLKRMLMDMQEGAKVEKADALLKYDISIAAGFPNLRADSVITAVKNGAASARDSDVKNYERSIDDAKEQVSIIKSDYQIFKTKFDNVLKAAKEGKLVAGSTMVNGVSRSVDISQSVLPYLEKAETSLVSYEKDSMLKVDTKLAFHDKALEIFKNQLGYVDAGAVGVAKDYSENVLGTADRISKELAAIEVPAGGQPTPAQQKRIVEIFTELTGSASQIQIDTTVPAPTVQTGVKLDPNALAYNTAGIKDFRDGVAAPMGAFVADQTSAALGNMALLDKPMKWRGLPKDKPFDGDKANDAAAITAESDAWKTTSPSGKTTIDQLVDLPNLAPESLVAGALRGSLHIPTDAKSSRIDPTVAVTLLQPVVYKMTAVTKQIVEGWKIDMDNPTGATSPGTNNGTGTLPGGTPVGNSVTSKSDSLLSQYNSAIITAQTRYDIVDANSAKCTSKVCKTNLETSRSELGKMKDLKSEIVRLKAEAPTASAERLTEMNSILGRIEGDLAASSSRFNTAVAIVEYRESLGSGSGGNSGTTHQPQQVIIHVQGGQGGNATANATAGANATSGSSLTSKPTSTVNNNTVNNTTVVKPHTAPVAKPKAPVSFLIGPVEFKTSSNSGDTVVYKSNWTIYPWYTVTCSRQADNSFKVTAGQKNNGIMVSAFGGFNNKACR